MHESIARVIDLDRYPIHELEGEAARGLVARAREQLTRTGACELPDFVRPAALAAMAAEATALVPKAHHHEGKATPYLELPDESWPEDHPRKSWNPFSLKAVAWDHIPKTGDLATLYQWDGLTDFVAACLGTDTLHRYGDPLGACSINVMVEKDEVEWHFDMADFVVSIALTDADRGGDFLYAPLIRSDEEENYDGVKRLLDGVDTGVTQIPMRPGTLLLFEGRHSIHCVSPVEGATPRLVALLAYDRRPGTCASKLLQLSRYGRVQQPDEPAVAS